MCLLGLGSMNIPDCPACGGRMRTNGTTSAGRTRWRCKECGSSTSRTYDHRAADLRSGLDWLFFTRTLAQGPVSARTQQRRNRLIWSLMPPVPLVRQRHDVVQVDGIWLHRRAVVLVAVADGHVIGWRVARHEDSVVWGLLMGRIAAPRVLVCDGGGGIAFGSRLLPQSQVTRSPKREFISRTYNLMLRSYLAVSFHDAQCGFKTITAQAAHVLLPQVKDDEWFFDTELLVRAQQAGMTMLELPVRWVEDAGSTVDIPDTVKKDLEGMHRVREGMEARIVDGLRIDLDSPAVWAQIRQHELRGSLLPAKDEDPHSRMQNPAKETAAC